MIEDLYEDFWSRRRNESLRRINLHLFEGDCRYWMLIKSFYFMTMLLVMLLVVVLTLLMFC